MSKTFTFRESIILDICVVEPQEQVAAEVEAKVADEEFAEKAVEAEEAQQAPRPPLLSPQVSSSSATLSKQHTPPMLPIIYALDMYLL